MLLQSSATLVHDRLRSERLSPFLRRLNQFSLVNHNLRNQFQGSRAYQQLNPYQGNQVLLQQLSLCLANQELLLRPLQQHQLLVSLPLGNLNLVSRP